MTSKGRRHAVSASAWPPVIEGGVAPPPSRPNLAVSWASEGSAASPLLGTPARPAKKAGIRQRLGGYNRLGTGCSGSAEALQTLNRYVDQLSQMWQALRAEGPPARPDAGVSRPHPLCELVALRLGGGPRHTAANHKLPLYPPTRKP